MRHNSPQSRSDSMESVEFTSVLVRRIQRGCAAALFAIAATAGVGWAMNWRVLAATRTIYIPMAPNTAVSFVLLGISLWMLTLRRKVAPGVRLGVPRTSAAIVGLIGLVRVWETSTNVDLGVDRWFFDGPDEV